MPGEMMVGVTASRSEHAAGSLVLDVRLLGPFAVATGTGVTRSWPRPSARRICQLVLVSPGRSVSREAACRELFPDHAPRAANKGLYKALSMARAVLGELSAEAAELLSSDHSTIWAAREIALNVDLDAHEQALRAALAAAPGDARDSSILEALAVGGTPLADELEAEWALRVRERIEYLRQEARLTLARDRSRGLGRARPDEVVGAWQSCLDAEPSCDEAASALVRLHAAQGRRQLAVAVYQRCYAAHAELGLPVPAALEEAYRSATPSGARSSPDGSDAVAPPRSEERRLVTVVAVEVTPTGLGSRTDPEDLRELAGAGLASAISEVETFGGGVESISGTGMSVLFGAPQSHEDDPERALRSALRIVAALAERRGAAGDAPSGTDHARPVTSLPGLSVRIGVETGLAVIGVIGGGGGASYGAVGDVVAVAEALKSVAGPGSVLVGPATRAATEEIFEWGTNAPVPVAPGGGPLAGTYLRRARARSSAQAGRRRLASAATVVGRGPELAVLSEAVRATVAGSGAVVLVVGEPGLGKTRLVAECRNYFMGWVGAASGRLPLWLEGRCASYASSTPYGAYQQLLARFVGAPLDAGEAVLRPAFEAAVRAVLGASHQSVPLLAQMIGLDPGPAGAHLARMAPAELQHATLSAMRNLLERLLQHGPTVLALEDLHWSDAASLRLTAELARLAATAPLLVLATRRPEPDPGVGELEAELAADAALTVQFLQLAPIEKSAERSLARSLLGGEVEDEVLDMVCDGADGVPLFLEERLASLLDSGALARDGSGWRVADGDPTPVPEALERLIRSRVDRLGPAAREAIVAASVLGDEFERSALGAVSELEGELDEALEELVSANLLTEVGSGSEPRYRFRHALIREATYNALLRSQRRQLHARAAWNLETSAAGRLEEVAAVLGNHFAAAGEGERALHYLEIAGDRAAQIYANDDAVASYRQALEVIDRQSARADARQPPGALAGSVTAASLCEKLASVLRLIDRLGEARTAALAGLARVRAEEVLSAARLQVLLANIEYQLGHYDADLVACDAAQELIGTCSLEDDQERVDLWMGVQFQKAIVHWWRNDAERLAALVDSVRPLVEARGGPDVVSLFYSLLALQHMRERRFRVDAQIVEECRRAVDVARTCVGASSPVSGGPERLLRNRMQELGMALTWHGDLDEARQVHEQVLASGEREGSIGVRGIALVGLAVTAFRRGDVEVVRELAAQGRASFAPGAAQNYYSAAAIALQAWVAWRDQRLDQAHELAIEALELWGAQPGLWPFHCLALWPLAGAHLDTGQVEEAVGAARRLLEPSQARLPDELEAAVHAACAAWDQADLELAGQLLADAVELARALGYA